MLTKIRMIFILLALLATANSYAGNVYLGPELFLQDNTAESSNFRALVPRVFVGYADLIEDFYLAGEVFIDPFSMTIANNNNNGLAANTRTTISYGASFLPGGMITEHILGFVRLGVVSSQFSSPDTSRAGGQVGIGLQTCLTRYWDLRAEYVYTAYKTVPTLGSVKSDQVGIGLVYKVLG